MCSIRLNGIICKASLKRFHPVILAIFIQYGSIRFIMPKSRALVLISFFILPKYRCIVFRFSSAENLAKKLHHQLLVVSNIGVQFIPPTRCYPETSAARRSADSPVCREFPRFPEKHRLPFAYPPVPLPDPPGPCMDGDGCRTTRTLLQLPAGGIPSFSASHFRHPPGHDMIFAQILPIFLMPCRIAVTSIPLFTYDMMTIPIPAFLAG